MKRAAFLIASMFAGVMAAVCFAAAQQSTTPSLGELARQMKAQREKESSKPAKEYNNENIPKSGDLMLASSSESAGGEKEGTSASAQGKSKSGVHDEKYYHDRMAELQSQREIHQRELDVLEKKLSQAQMQYYPDPNKALKEQFSRDEINKKTDDIEKKKKQIEADDKALEDLQQQCQREGCPAGWLR